MNLEIHDDVAFSRVNTALIESIHLLAEKELDDKLPPEIIEMIKGHMYSSDNVKFLKLLCLLNRKNNSIFNYKTIRTDNISSILFVKKFSFKRISENPKHPFIPRHTIETRTNIIPYIKKMNGKIFLTTR